jgi:predicted HicB family RNase H-like nuclease
MSTVHFTVRMPAAEHAKLVKLAERELSSLNREITIAVRAHLDADAQKRKVAA